MWLSTTRKGLNLHCWCMEEIECFLPPTLSHVKAVTSSHCFIVCTLYLRGVHLSLWAKANTDGIRLDVEGWQVGDMPFSSGREICVSWLHSTKIHSYYRKSCVGDLELEHVCICNSQFSLWGNAWSACHKTFWELAWLCNGSGLSELLETLCELSASTKCSIVFCPSESCVDTFLCATSRVKVN